MDNFDPYNVLLAIATNIPVLLMTAFVLQGHICFLLSSVTLTNFVGWSEPYSCAQRFDKLHNSDPSHGPVLILFLLFSKLSYLNK